MLSERHTTVAPTVAASRLEGITAAQLMCLRHRLPQRVVCLKKDCRGNFSIICSACQKSEHVDHPTAQAVDILPQLNQQLEQQWSIIHQQNMQVLNGYTDLDSSIGECISALTQVRQKSQSSTNGLDGMLDISAMIAKWKETTQQPTVYLSELRTLAHELNFNLEDLSSVKFGVAEQRRLESLDVQKYNLERLREYIQYSRRFLRELLHNQPIHGQSPFLQPFHQTKFQRPPELPLVSMQQITEPQHVDSFEDFLQLQSIQVGHSPHEFEEHSFAKLSSNRRPHRLNSDLLRELNSEDSRHAPGFIQTSFREYSSPKLKPLVHPMPQANFDQLQAVEDMFSVGSQPILQLQEPFSSHFRSTTTKYEQPLHASYSSSSFLQQTRAPPIREVGKLSKSKSLWMDPPIPVVSKHKYPRPSRKDHAFQIHSQLQVTVPNLTLRIELGIH